MQLLDQAPPLGSLEKASARLLELHQTIAREESLRLAAENDRSGLMSVDPAEARARRTPDQTAREDLIRECRKQRNVTPMRTLVRRTAQSGLLDVVPVWLMSPETTAILFPREPVFDLLIVDEASQCTVENGLPVLTRARRAVIAGDDKQMPPSSFFKAASTLELDAAADNPGAEVPVDAFESESLLVLARNGGSGAPLRWHYRALFEELIAFSNHSMYGGSLLTIPATRSRSAAPAVRWVRVEDGTWDAGSNPPEARRVVALLGELLSRPQPPTVGIVTFNLQQRRTILDEIDSRRSADAEFARVFDLAASAELLDARPFVKNLESVQGDERDVILFSLGYAPTRRKRRDGSEETYVPARFGPLGQKGGERRLNVAVSRAKAEIVVVSSFDPAMLSVAHTKHDGPRMFKAFVEFARHLGEGRRNQAEKILSLVNDATQSRRILRQPAEDSAELHLPLHHQIALALEADGTQGRDAGRHLGVSAAGRRRAQRGRSPLRPRHPVRNRRNRAGRLRRLRPRAQRARPSPMAAPARERPRVAPGKSPRRRADPRGAPLTKKGGRANAGRRTRVFFPLDRAGSPWPGTSVGERRAPVAREAVPRCGGAAHARPTTELAQISRWASARRRSVSSSPRSAARSRGVFPRRRRRACGSPWPVSRR